MLRKSHMAYSHDIKRSKNSTTHRAFSPSITKSEVVDGCSCDEGSIRWDPGGGAREKQSERQDQVEEG
jgi:hypothetical protein